MVLKNPFFPFQFPSRPQEMSPEIRIVNKISRIVRIRQMLRRWRKKAAADVPAGHVAIQVGSSSRRFVVPATHLNHPFFKKLLVQAEEEYGFVNQGPLTIPCEESVFEEVLRFVSRAESSNSARRVCFENFQRCSLEGYRKINIAESRPLLGGYAG